MWQRQIPNLVTLFRFLLIVPILGLIQDGQHAVALGLFVLAGLSDGVDGWLARHHGWRTRLGAFLDPLADKALMTSVVLMLGWHRQLPWWLVTVIIGRDLVILAGATAFYLLTRHLEMQPTRLSKLNTVMQILLVAAVLWHYGIAPLTWLGWLMWTTLFTTLASGIDYVLRWSLKAREALRQ